MARGAARSDVVSGTADRTRRRHSARHGAGGWEREIINESDPQFVQFVKEAASVTYSSAVGQPTHEVYVLLASELRRRGIYPDPEAVLAAAMLISRGKMPAVLRG